MMEQFSCHLIFFFQVFLALNLTPARSKMHYVYMWVLCSDTSWFCLFICFVLFLKDKFRVFNSDTQNSRSITSCQWIMCKSVRYQSSLYNPCSAPLKSDALLLLLSWEPPAEREIPIRSKNLSSHLFEEVYPSIQCCINHWEMQVFNRRKTLKAKKVHYR